MLKAGNYTIDDKGLALSLERLGGTAREVLVLELGGGIPDEALEAICAGPIEVLDESGAVVHTHTGPFYVASHSVRLVRANAESDVAALTARVASLEAELVEARNQKDSAMDSLASLNTRFEALKERVAAAASGDKAILDGLESGKLTGIVKKEAGDAAGSVQE